MSAAETTQSPLYADHLNSDSKNGHARHAALAAVLPKVMSPTSLVGYHSGGRLLIVGPGSSVRQAAENVSKDLTVTLLITDTRADTRADVGDGPEPRSSAALDEAVKSRSIQAEVAGIRGYLGNFQVDILSDGELRPLAPSILTANQPYDLVLDLGSKPQITCEVPPSGYYAPGRDGERIQEALDSLAELVGEFEKPRYFNYNTDICAHGASGQSGCRRCLEACPTDAIKSIGERIEVDPYLCQGGGGCASTCPSGALRYAYPALPDLLMRMQALINAYLQADGQAPSVLLHDADSGTEWLLEHAAELPENCLPFGLEEVASVGLESWLSLLAFGASGVAILCHEQTPATLRAVIIEQMAIAQAMLIGMGYPCGRILLLEAGDPPACLAGLAGFDSTLIDKPARYQVVDEKRTTTRQALDHLYAHAPLQAISSELPAGAPFGEIQIDTESCTLCTACVSVCPAGAVLAGDELPQLSFIEQNCVQCGVCANACPENSITLHSRIVYSLPERSRRRIVNEDQPFHCVRCNKPFAGTRSIEAITSKLASHWMYVHNPGQIQRLKMCEDCRVRDMFEQDAQLLDVHKD